jgi:hypothetical protein
LRPCSELELQKTGVEGAYVIDDKRKYPQKEDVGPLLGATGGFAGGEKGIEQLVQVRLEGRASRRHSRRHSRRRPGAGMAGASSLVAALLWRLCAAQAAWRHGSACMAGACIRAGVQ